MASTVWAQDGNSGNSPSGGLTDAQRDRFENAINNDLDSVRDHSGSPAETISDSTSSRAVTHGEGLVLGDTAYSPGSNSGGIIEYELEHVVDQAGNESQPQSSEAGEGETDDERVGRQRLDRPIERRTRSRSIPDSR
ncbi:DUF4157 domain-containing protein [Hyphobacterium sp.]|uniref:eCIS core domain-containing protein n=1 Tax=Hyphobacterium sp. TaxID=2004662 RepID=UPI003BA84BCC